MSARRRWQRMSGGHTASRSVRGLTRAVATLALLAHGLLLTHGASHAAAPAAEAVAQHCVVCAAGESVPAIGAAGASDVQHAPGLHAVSASEARDAASHDVAVPPARGPPSFPLFSNR